MSLYLQRKNLAAMVLEWVLVSHQTGLNLLTEYMFYNDKIGEERLCDKALDEAIHLIYL